MLEKNEHKNIFYKHFYASRNIGIDTPPGHISTFDCITVQ